jgi:hypothetical protein
MTFRFGRRARRLAVVAAVLFVPAAGIAYATIPDSSQVYTACMLKSVGTIRLIDTSLSSSNLLGHCTSLETPITWNGKGQPGPAGQPGAAGQSPTVTQLASGDASCAAGGAAITDANGSTAYVCNGANGADGQPFSGTFTSPNGEYSISVADTGIAIQHGTHVRITLAGDDLTIRAGQGIDVRSALGTTLNAGTGLSLKAGTTASLDGGAMSTVTAGGIVQLGSGTCLPVARFTDPVSAGAIVGGSATVCAGA